MSAYKQPAGDVPKLVANDVLSFACGAATCFGRVAYMDMDISVAIHVELFQ